MVVQGDTTSTFVGALAAFYHQIPVAHMEAGLRTGDVYSPYPEEINRRLTTQLTALHLAPTPTSAANLKSDNVDSDAVICTGNTVIDALFEALRQPVGWNEPALADLRHSDRPRAARDRPPPGILGGTDAGHRRALARIARAEPDLEIVFPIHLNPVVRESIQPAVAGLPNVRLIEPLGYGDFCHLMNRAHLVLTDSGGVQEEAPGLGKPVLVMRDTTERPEAVLAGTVQLVGTDEDRIVNQVRHLLHDREAYQRMAQAVNPYGDGRAAQRTVAAIRHFFGEGPAGGVRSCLIGGDEGLTMPESALSFRERNNRWTFQTVSAGVAVAFAAGALAVLLHPRDIQRGQPGRVQVAIRRGRRQRTDRAGAAPSTGSTRGQTLPPGGATTKPAAKAGASPGSNSATASTTAPVSRRRYAADRGQPGHIPRARPGAAAQPTPTTHDQPQPPTGQKAPTALLHQGK